MSDWVNRKKQQLASRSNDEERDRQIRSQILASTRPFWQDMLESMTESKNAWNSDAGRDEIFIHQAGGATDSLNLIVRGRDDEVGIELLYNVPQIRYTVKDSRKSGTLHFALDHDEIHVFNKAEPTKRYSATRAADFFLDQVVHG